MKKKALVVALSALVLLGAGCSSGSSPAGSTDSGKKGAAHKENAPELVTLAEQTKACKFEETFGFSGYTTCPAYGSIKDTAKNYDTGFKTVMNFIEDENAGIRYSGAHALGLSFYDKALFSNAADMNRLLDAIKKESYSVVAIQMAGPLVRFATNVTSDTTAVMDWAKDASYAKPKARAEFFRLFSADSTDKAGWFDVAAAVAKNTSDDAEVRSNALYAIARTKTRVADAKAIMKELSTSSEKKVADAATYISEKMLK